ncbi:MAG: hypothetical protein JO119_13925 [Acidobacteria bacterium]|nr:hypothetical protein [Acidobacteriota bacterium]
MAQHLEGSSQDVANNFLRSDFWEPGVQIAGIVRRKFQSVNGQCYAVELDNPVSLNGEETRDVALGNLTGLRMAVQAAGAEDLNVGDKFTLECTDLQPTGKGNPRIDFRIEIDRR